MIKFEWKLNGRSVAPGQLGRELAKSVHGEIVSRAKSAVARARCPVHGQSPRNIESCCDRLKQAVSESFK